MLMEPENAAADEREALFRDLAKASLRVSGHLLSTLTDGQEETLERAFRSGAQLVLEFGPLPAFDKAALVLVEREGKRHEVMSLQVKTASVQ